MKKSKLTIHEFLEFLQELADSGVVRVVGSYADGTANTRGHLSDLDLYVLQEDRGMKKVIEIFNRHGVPWDSVITGSISSPRNAEYMFLPVECSYLFRCKRGRTFPIEICGVKFLAYQQ